MATAFSYIRFSSSKQRKGISKERQEQEFREFCQRHRLTPSTQTYANLATSGFHGAHAKKRRGRPGLAEFIEAVDAGTVQAGDFLVIENLDRLSREPIEHASERVFGLIRRGIKLAVMTPVETIYDSSSVNGGAVWMLLGELQRAHGESVRKSFFTQSTWKNRRTKGLLGGARPFWLDKTFRVIPERAKVVQDIFQWAIQGQGVSQIVKRLNGDKVKPVRANRWIPATVHLVLRSKVVFGHFEPTLAGQKLKPIDYPVIVSEDDFHKVQVALGTRKPRRGRVGNDVANLFTGLLYGADGQPLWVAHSNGHAYLTSAGNKLGLPNADKTLLDFQTVENVLVQKLGEMLLGDMIRPVKLEEDNSDILDLASVEGTIAQLEAEDIADVPALVRKMRTLEEKRKAIQARIEAKKLTAATASFGEEDIDDLLDCLQGPQNDPEQRRRARYKFRCLLAMVVERITLTPVKVEKAVKTVRVDVHFVKGQKVSFRYIHWTMGKSRGNVQVSEK